MPTKTMKKTAPKKAKTVLGHLAFFDDSPPDPTVRHHFEGEPFSTMPELFGEDYTPRGMTPLNDATIQMVTKLEHAFAERPDAVHIGMLIDESGSMGPNRQSVVDGYNEFVGSLRGEKPSGKGRVLLVVMTDGRENASEATASTVKEIVEKHTATDLWEFLYLGANVDAWAEGGQMGYANRAGSYANFTSSPVGTRSAMRKASGMSSAYLASASVEDYRATSDAVMAQAGNTIDEDDGTAAPTAPTANTPLWTPGDKDPQDNQGEKDTTDSARKFLRGDKDA